MNEIATTQNNTMSMLTNADTMNALVNFAHLMSQSVVTLPKHLQGKPSDCLAIAMQAVRWGMDPYVVAQKTHIVNGNLGYEAQLVNAVLMSSGAIRGRFHYEYQGEGASIACRVGAIPAGENEVVFTQWLRLDQVATKNSPLWKTNPKQQIGYLQVKNWGRQYAPGALLGVYSVDELEVAQPESSEPKDITPQKSSVDKLKPAAKPAAPVSFDEAPSRVEQLIINLAECQTADDVNAWGNAAAAEFAEGTPEYAQLLEAYNKKLAEIA